LLETVAGYAQGVGSILVADDNRGFAELLRATLEEAGYHVVTASTGLAAVACLQHNDVDVAVLDVLMPGISGDAVAERLRQLEPNLPVLLMTGSDGDFAAGSGLPLLRKPFPQEELLEAVRNLVR
jgi:CheY-like chemotaxis protein